LWAIYDLFMKLLKGLPMLELGKAYLKGYSNSYLGQISRLLRAYVKLSKIRAIKSLHNGLHKDCLGCYIKVTSRPI